MTSIYDSLFSESIPVYLFNSDVQRQITLYGAATKDVVKRLGYTIPPNNKVTGTLNPTVVLSPIIQEYYARLQDPISQNISDSISKYANSTHNEIVKSYNEVRQLSRAERNDIRSFKKFGAPIMFDVGYANVQLYTAIRLLNKYQVFYPSDPLSLDHYKTDFVKLRQDLTNPNSNTSIKLSALMVEDGFQWSAANVDNWNELSPAQQEGLAVYYYRVGDDFMELRLQEAQNSGVPYRVDMENTTISQQHIINRQVIEERIDAADGIIPNPLSEEDLKLREEIKQGLHNLNYCFAAGTPVELPDGTSKPIEQIKIGDEVLAYDASDRDGQGDLSPRRVTRTYATPDKLVIDFHGLKVTPGHVFLCGDGEFAGQHRMLMEILRSDGTIVSADGTVLRAATNAPVESREDAFVQVAYLTDTNDALMQSGRMRAGTLILTPEGESKTVLACLEEDGYRFDAETGLIAKDGEEPHALYWYGEIPRPEDYVLKRSELTDADLYAEPGYQPEVAASAAPSKLGRGFTPAEGTLHATAAKQAGETIH